MIRDMIRWFKSLFKHKEIWEYSTGKIGFMSIKTKTVKVKRDKLGRFK